MSDDKDDFDHIPEGPLTEAELHELRRILEADRRAKWLWATVRRTLAYGAALASGAVAFRDDILELVKWIAPK